MEYLFILIVVTLIVGEAIYEALARKGKKFYGKLIELFVRGLELTIVAAYFSHLYPILFPGVNFWRIVGFYITIRIAIFRIVWNMIALKNMSFYSREKKIWLNNCPHCMASFWDKYLYIGTTDWYDDMLYWICYKSPIKAPPSIFLPVWEGWWFLLSIGFATGTIIQ